MLFGILKVILLLLFLKVTQNNGKHEEIEAVPIMELLCYLWNCNNAFTYYAYSWMSFPVGNTLLSIHFYVKESILIENQSLLIILEQHLYLFL